MAFLNRVNAVVEAHDGRIPWDDYFMSVALLVRGRSACDRLHVGCVVVNEENRIISTGYNGFVAGLPHQSNVVVEEGDGRPHEQNTLHAEQNCVVDCASRMVSMEGATVYVTHYPCVNCTKLLLGARVGAIKYLWKYNNSAIAEQLYELSMQTDRGVMPEQMSIGE